MKKGLLTKILAIVLLLSATAAASVAGTLAYLTDRDSKANVFTVGNVQIQMNEDFQNGAELIPGVEIEKKPTITNIGDNDAWVWFEFAIPSALDNFVQGTEQGSNENVIHWNPKGATTEGYVTDTRVQDAIASGFFGEMDTTNLTAQYINDNHMHWNVFNSIADGVNAYPKEIEVDGKIIPYNVYVLLYNKALEPGETTLPNIEKVFLDARVDIDPDGNGNFVDNGAVDPIEWNLETNGNPVIYVSAYAIQTEGFKTVNEAYAAYQTQWGENGSEYGELPILVSNVDEMRQAMKTPGAQITLTDDIVIDDDKGTEFCLYAKYDTTIDLNGHSLVVDMSGKEFYGVIYALKGAKVDIVGEGEIEITNGIGPFVWATGADGETEVNIYGGNWTNTSPDFTTEDSNYCEGLYSNRNGVINIHGGFFDWSEFSKYTVNESREGVVNVYGGTFVNFDPRVSHDNDGSYVAEGYTVVSETQANGDVWYTVVAE